MKEYVLALDLGGTNSVLGLVDREGNILEVSSFRTQDYPQIEAYVGRCATEASALIERAGGREHIRAFGIGAPDVNYWQRTI